MTTARYFLTATVLFAMASFAVLGLPERASAVLIQHDGITVFVDSFEAVSPNVGLVPNNGDLPGSWAPGSANNPPLRFADVRSTPLAAFEGSNYLYLERVSGNTELRATVDTGINDGAVHVEFMVNIPAASSLLFGPAPTIGGSSQFGAYVTPDGAGNIVNYVGALFDTGLDYQVDTWQKWEWDFSFVGGTASTFKLTVDGVSASGLPFWNPLTSFNYVEFGTGVPSNWQVDATGPVLVPESKNWKFDRSGDWNVSSNWDFGVPSTNTTTAIFGSAITAPRTVYTDSDVTVKAITFDNANAYVVAGPGNINLQADAGNASLNVVQGTHEFQVRVNLLSNTDADVATAATLEFNNRLSLGGKTLTKTGGGAIKINNDLNTGGGSIVVLGGSVGGGGSIAGDLNNTSGTVAPGNSPGRLTVQGNFSQAAGGALSVEIAGLAAGTQYDQLVVTGNATLDGTLAVTLLNSFAPSLGNSFSVLIYGSHSGTFSSTTGTTLGGHLALKPTYGNTSLLLKARPAQDGDINLDGIVNIFDINSVSSNWSTTGPQGDANGDGIVNIFDINLISSNWGAMGSATAVPEPSTGILLVVGAALFAVARVRRSRQRL